MTYNQDSSRNPQHAARTSLILALVCLQFVVVGNHAFGEPPRSTATKPKVICFGDSITNRGYPKILEELVAVDAINAGVGGNSTAKALRRLKKDVLTREPDVVVVQFGTNDLRADADHAYVPVAQFRANLESIVDQCRTHNATIVLCTLPPIDHDAFFTRHEREPFDALGGLGTLITNYRDAARQVANDRQATLVDLNSLLAKEPSWMSQDGVHPSAAGNAIIAKHVAAAVSSLLQDATPPTRPHANQDANTSGS